MKFCYCDESGVGSEPIATMAGIVADQHRMRKTKEEWEALLRQIGERAEINVIELKTSDLHKGRGDWRYVSGEIKSDVVEMVLKFIADRRHPIVVTAVDKSAYRAAINGHVDVPNELSTEWKFIGFHLILALQNAHKKLARTTGDTICVFDNREHDKIKFADVIAAPGAWSDEYYGRARREEPLKKIVDAPYFGDSRELPLIQIADFVSFIYRRYAEVVAGVGPRPFKDEAVKLDGWVRELSEYNITPRVYPQRGRTNAHELFYKYAPECIRSLS